MSVLFKLDRARPAFKRAAYRITDCPTDNAAESPLPHSRWSIVLRFHEFRKSGRLLSDIKIPEVISLCVWIRQVRFDYSKDPLTNIRAGRGDIGQFFPVINPAASDYVVDCGEGPVRVIQMPMQHSARNYTSLEGATALRAFDRDFHEPSQQRQQHHHDRQ